MSHMREEERKRERKRKSVKNASLNEKQLSVTANHARKSSNIKSNYIELKLPRRGNFCSRG